MKLITADAINCVKCGKCVVVCPMKVIEMEKGGLPEPKSYAYKLCINCGYCVDVCVFDALKHQVRKRSANSNAAIKRYDAMMLKNRSANNEK